MTFEDRVIHHAYELGHEITESHAAKIVAEAHRRGLYPEQYLQQLAAGGSLIVPENPDHARRLAEAAQLARRA